MHNPFPAVVRKHQARELDRREHDRQHERLNPHQRGYTRKWREVSQKFLQAHPLCAGFASVCEERGKFTPSTEVDHVVPHRGNLRLFWDTENWQALCHTCHSRKTAMEDGGFGHPVTPSQDRQPRYTGPRPKRGPVTIDVDHYTQETETERMARARIGKILR